MTPSLLLQEGMVGRGGGGASCREIYGGIDTQGLVQINGRSVEQIADRVLSGEQIAAR